MKLPSKQQCIKLHQLGWKEPTNSYLDTADGLYYKTGMKDVAEGLPNDCLWAPSTDEMLEVLCNALTLGHEGRWVEVRKASDTWMELPDKWFAQRTMNEELDYFSSPMDSPAEALADLLIKLLESKEITL